jgi:ABC-type phosphate transport system substrate-binding protein
VKRLLPVFVLVLLVAPWARPQSGPAIQVIAHGGAPSQSLTHQQVADLFLKKTTRWPDGTTAALPVDLPADAALRESFSQQFLERSARAVVSYWNRQIFSGRAVPPSVLESEDKVVEFVRANAGAIGYVSAALELPDGVRAVRITP